MSTRKPKWQRLGFRAVEEYSAACSATKKTRRAALAASEAKGATRAILKTMWDAADFHRPLVKITKEQIMCDADVSLKTVQRALQALRSEGSIRPIAGWQGGRGKATTWQLCVTGKETSPSDEMLAVLEATREREAAWRFLRGKYGPLKALEMMGDECG